MDIKSTPKKNLKFITIWNHLIKLLRFFFCFYGARSSHRERKRNNWQWDLETWSSQLPPHTHTQILWSLTHDNLIEVCKKFSFLFLFLFFCILLNLILYMYSIRNESHDLPLLQFYDGKIKCKNEFILILRMFCIPSIDET